MKRRFRHAASAGALSAALLMLLSVASRAVADAPALAGLSMAGTARGLQVNFGFQDYVLGNFVDIGSPHASTELSSAGGGQSRSVASQMFPGNLIAGNGAARERIPGFREANYPANKDTKDIDKDDDTHTNDALSRTAGPISIDTSHLKTHAGEDAASALVTTHRFALEGADGPLLQISSVETTSDSKGVGSTIVQDARTTIRDLTLTVSEDLTIHVGQIVAAAHSTSDGEEGDASANFTISDVEAILSGQHFRATIDEDGIKLVSPVEGAPSAIPQPLSQEFGAILDRFGVSITTSKPVEIVEDATADATVGGLLITLQGAIPSAYTPDAAKALYAQILDAIPEQEICPPDNPIGRCSLREICPNAAAPLCVTPNVVPGPGQGFVTSFAIGLAHAAASAAKPFEFGPGAPPGNFEPGDLGGPPPGGFVPPPGPGFTQSPGGQGGQSSQPNLPLFGLVAKMPPGAILGAGAFLIVVAVLLAMGPSLSRWRPRATP
jgi:hypothetical protein